MHKLRKLNCMGCVCVLFMRVYVCVLCECVCVLYVNVGMYVRLCVGGNLSF